MRVALLSTARPQSLTRRSAAAKLYQLLVEQCTRYPRAGHPGMIGDGFSQLYYYQGSLLIIPRLLNRAYVGVVRELTSGLWHMGGRSAVSSRLLHGVTMLHGLPHF